MTGGTPTITCERVSKWYGDVLGVNEVTVEFGPGVTGLLGPNGAGKSTLIKLVCGMLRPSIGRIRLNGHNPFARSAPMVRVGLCPEQDAFYSGASAHSVVTYLTKLQGFDAGTARVRAQKALERVGLSEAAHRSVAAFSKGMRQRFKLAQALAHDPDVVILDEPMNGLDPTTRHEMGELVKALGTEGRCVLVSSHVLHEVDALAQRMVVMRHGRIIADGTARALREEMSEVPLTVSIQSETPAALAVHVVALDGVRRVERTERGLDVHTTQADDLFDAVARLAAGGDVSVDGIAPTDEDLEAVFRYLTE